MKKFTVSIFILLLLAQFAFAQGIGNAKDLIAFIEACNNAQSTDQWLGADSCFHFTADIDLSKEKKVPQLASFVGVLNGEGHSIKGWKTSQALINEIQRNSEVSGITFDASCVFKLTSKGETMAAFLVNTNSGKVTNCKNCGSLSFKCNYMSMPIFVGGLVASNRYVVMDCLNAGKIEGICSGAEQKAELAANVGGVVGGNPGKSEIGNTIIRCVNEGSVYFSSDFPVSCIGGVIGNALKGSTKYCVNKGSVKSTSFKSDAEKPAKPQEAVGGVAGYTKWDVACCDNFGSVTTDGKAAAYVGGIVGQPHAALDVTDCVNYGVVEGKNENVNYVGGISGNVGRPAHFRRCFNRGTVIFDGVCMESRSCAGGIVGQVYCPKTSTAGTYIRECANYGEIIAKSGGNRASSGDDAIHAGGIVGYMSTREGFKGFLSECSNFGKITAETGVRRGNICPVRPDNTKTGGSLTPEDVVLCKALPDGSNVCGKVCDREGRGLEGIVVTDGRQCIKTGADGTYKMTSNLAEAHFIYISIPAGATVAMRQGIPIFFKRIPRGAQAVQADFTVDPGTPSSKYTILMIGDPQVRPFGVDDSMERWWDTVAPDAEKFRAANPLPTYCINLGDLVYNFMYAYDDYLDAAAQIKCPTFNVIGNHDYDQQTLFEGSLGWMYFENYVTPEHYSFDLGNIHYVVLNTIQYGRPNATAHYGNGIDDRTMEWLKNDLSYVSKDRIVVTCSHAQMFKKNGTSPNGSHGAYNSHYEDYRQLLKEYKAVYTWSGHYHHNFQYNYATHKTKWGAPNIQSICVSRCTGALRLNKPLGSDGEPQGYMVVNVDGDNIDWYFKGVGMDKSRQMSTYSPVRTQDGYVKANIWNWSDEWSAPVWYENGKPVGEMEFHPEEDPDYLVLFSQVTSKKTRKYCKPSANTYMFRITPSQGVTSGEVRVKDQFGNEYKQTISW